MEKQVVKKKKLKKIVRHKKKKSLFHKYGLLLAIFFILSICYFSWLYGVPAYLNATVTQEKVCSFLEPKIGFKIDYKTSVFYTTPSLDVGVRFKDVKVYFPNANLNKKRDLFMKSRLAVFEIPVIPYLLKTIRFNECSFRSVNINLYQDVDGHYAYIQNIKENFNPQMPKYLVEVPRISLISYNIENFNHKTAKFKKMRGNIMNISPKQSRIILKSAKQGKSIMLK